MACTWIAPVSVTRRGAAVRLTTTRSALWRPVQSDPAASVPAAAAGALVELAPAELAAAAGAPDESALAEAG
jgi:hypothetical protein